MLFAFPFKYMEEMLIAQLMFVIDECDLFRVLSDLTTGGHEALGETGSSLTSW